MAAARVVAGLEALMVVILAVEMAAAAEVEKAAAAAVAVLEVLVEDCS